jgi:uncharacterized alpha-E superfamily protein
VWIVSDGPVESITLLPAPAAPYARMLQGVLPSRAADNLYWLGRYIERAEGVIRMLRAHHIRLAETGDPKAPQIAYLAEHLEAAGIDSSERIPEGLLWTLNAAITSAGNVRERFSTDGWMALNDLARTARRMDETVDPGDDTARAMGVLLRKITGFSGLVHENMYRFTGWRFLIIGRSLERSMTMAGLLASLAAPEAPDGALDMAVEIGDSVMSHRRRYAVSTSRQTVIDLLALDMMNPRSVLYQLTELRDQVAFLPDAEHNGQLSKLSRAVLQMHTALAVQTPETVDDEMLLALRAELAGLSELLSETYLR